LLLKNITLLANDNDNAVLSVKAVYTSGCFEAKLPQKASRLCFEKSRQILRVLQCAAEGCQVITSYQAVTYILEVFAN